MGQNPQLRYARRSLEQLQLRQAHPTDHITLLDNSLRAEPDSQLAIEPAAGPLQYPFRVQPETRGSNVALVAKLGGAFSARQ